MLNADKLKLYTIAGGGRIAPQNPKRVARGRSVPACDLALKYFCKAEPRGSLGRIKPAGERRSVAGGGSEAPMCLAVGDVNLTEAIECSRGSAKETFGMPTITDFDRPSASTLNPVARAMFKLGRSLATAIDQRED